MKALEFIFIFGISLFLLPTNGISQITITPDESSPSKVYEFSVNPYGTLRLDIGVNDTSTFLGFSAGKFNGMDSIHNFSGTNNTGVGYNALLNNTNGYFHTALGSNALKSNTTGQKNTALGNRALTSNTIGSINCAVGVGALVSNTTGSFNVALGNAALASNTVGFSNVAIGTSALAKMEIGSDLTALGSSAMASLIQGNKSVAVGRGAFASSNQTYGSTAVGYYAGRFDTLSTNNIYVGNEAGAGGVSSAYYHHKSDNVMIGYQSGKWALGDGNVFLGNKSGHFESSSNKLYIENSDADSTTALIYGDFDNDLLTFNAGLTINKNSVTGAAQLNLKEDNGGFARLQFSNTSGKQITLAAIPNADTVNSELNFFIEDVGNVMTIQGDQRVGINETSPSQTLDVNAAVGDSPLRVRTGSTEHITVSSIGELDVNANAPSDYIMNITNNAPDSKFNDGLAIQINTLTSAENDNKYISFKNGAGSDIGAIRGNGSGSVELFQVSDRRHKQNIKTFNGGLDIIAQLDAYSYEMKVAPGKQQIGFIAQELYRTFPQMVSGTPETTTFEDPMMVDYAGITPVLVAAIKELDAKNQELSKELELMHEVIGDLKELKIQVNALQSQLDEEVKSEN